MRGSCPVSVIIVNHNAGARLCECVASILEGCPGATVIVVDNASSDESLSLLESRFPDQTELKFLRNEKNSGFAVACNMGTRLAEAPYLLYLNPDCLVDVNAVPTLLAALRAEPHAGMVGGLLLNPDGTEQAGGRRAIPTPWRALLRVFNVAGMAKRSSRVFSDFNLHRQPLPDVPIEVEAISGACMLVSRVALEKVGGFDEGYFLHCEDLDWCMRFRQEGFKILFVADARVVHHKGTCSRSRPVFVEWHKHRGMMRFYRKHLRYRYPGVLMWLVGTTVWLRFGLMAVYHTVRQHSLRLRSDHD
jgi:GT2 family glycosyltransferase